MVSPDTEGITKIHLELNNDYEKEVEYLKSAYEKYINLYEIFYNGAVEIVSSGASKLNTIKKIIQYEGIYDEIYTIGDGNSDIEMIKQYNGYVMKSVKEEIKRQCPNEIENIAKLIGKIRREN